MKVKLWITCAVGIVLAGGFLQCRNSRVDSAVDSAPNCYERAQNASVLIIGPAGSFGSGVVVKRGNSLFVWTAAHVVSNVDSVVVGSYLRERGEKVGVIQYSAKIIARNESLDLALLWLSGGGSYFGSVVFADEAPLRVGQSVYHVGNYWGADFDDSVSIGVISQVGVTPVSTKWPWNTQLDQTTAFVTYGSSGGGIFRHSDNLLVGIIVGSPAPGISDVNLFVPVRKILAWAKSESLLWAMYGNFSPPEQLLTKAANNAARQRAIASAVK